MPKESIFDRYYANPEFEDRLEQYEGEGIDVIIPVINTNELWERNLYTFYREIPINRLLIGDGGCTDDTIEIVEHFPRVEVIDQSEYETQGYCIKELIEHVETEIFVYLHADVFLPEGWFDEMYQYKDELDWYECYRRHTVLADYPNEQQNEATRAYSGSQMGRKETFDKFIDDIDDDFLQRNEDIVFAELIEERGEYDRIDDTFHYHQVMERQNPESSFGKDEPQITSVSIEKESAPEWEQKVAEMQWKGIIRYTSPKPYLTNTVERSIVQLMKTGDFEEDEFISLVREESPVWEDHIDIRKLYIRSKVETSIRKIKEGFWNTAKQIYREL